MATIGKTPSESKRYDTHDLNNGLKLMEHSWINNNYVEHIMAILDNNPQALTWLCDYHEPDFTDDLTWDNTNEVKTIIQKYTSSNIINNHTKDIYIDMMELGDLYKKDRLGSEDWYIHPLPILTNSDKQSQGGGDYNPEDSRRATWKGDIISTSTTPEENYENVTADVLFYEN